MKKIIAQIKYIIIFFCWFISFVIIYEYPVKMLIAEKYYFEHKISLANKNRTLAKYQILMAVALDPCNSTYNFFANQYYMNIEPDLFWAKYYLYKVIHNFNGDITLYSVYYLDAMMNVLLQDVIETRSALEKSLYYNPDQKEVQKMLDKTVEIIKESDRKSNAK